MEVWYWWDIPEKPGVTQLGAQFFTQYEETIDKFKPSYSITVNVTVSEEYCDCYDAANLIKFIVNEPYLAFCRDYHVWDYNVEYHTREEAKAEYDKYRAWKNKKDAATAELDSKMISFVKDKILPLFKDSRIFDEGDCCSPRYEVIAPFNSNTDIVDKPGTYDWFSEDSMDVLKEYKEILNYGKQLSDSYEFWWFEPFSPVVTFYQDGAFDDV